MNITQRGPAPGKTGRLRVYQTWKGNEKFFLKGYLVGGPNWKAVFGSSALIAAPAGIFIAFPATWLTLNLHAGAAIMVFSCLFPVLSLTFLFMTACRDPGIIPRQPPDAEYLEGRKPRTKEVIVNNQRVVIRYNDTCHFYQPPRAHHCSINDNCIERFDHHCPWVGTTIGKRNYRTFLLFVYTTTLFCLFSMGCCIAQLILRHNQLAQELAGTKTGTQIWNETLVDVAPALAVLGVSFLFVWFVGGLSGFHCYLVGTNQTTYENFRYNNEDRPNPYDRGLWLNCWEVWGEPLPPSKVDFRAFVGDDGMPIANPVSAGQGGAPAAAQATNGAQAAASAAAGAGPSTFARSSRSSGHPPRYAASGHDEEYGMPEDEEDRRSSHHQYEMPAEFDPSQFEPLPPAPLASEIYRQQQMEKQHLAQQQQMEAMQHRPSAGSTAGGHPPAPASTSSADGAPAGHAHAPGHAALGHPPFPPAVHSDHSSQATSTINPVIAAELAAAAAQGVAAKERGSIVQSFSGQQSPPQGRKGEAGARGTNGSEIEFEEVAKP